MHIVVFVTARDKAEAEKIAQELLKARLIACANIVDGIKSIFWWEGKVDQSQEALLILKSQKSRFPQIVKKVKSLHSYDLPEIIALPIVDGSKDYLAWIDSSVQA
jgi:periplasmic divalent cation tolerance protein